MICNANGIKIAQDKADSQQGSTHKGVVNLAELQLTKCLLKQAQVHFVPVLGYNPNTPTDAPPLVATNDVACHLTDLSQVGTDTWHMQL